MHVLISLIAHSFFLDFCWSRWSGSLGCTPTPLALPWPFFLILHTCTYNLPYLFLLQELTDHKYRSEAAIRELKAKLRGAEEVEFVCLYVWVTTLTYEWTNASHTSGSPLKMLLFLFSTQFMHWLLLKGTHCYLTSYLLLSISLYAFQELSHLKKELMQSHHMSSLLDSSSKELENIVDQMKRELKDKDEVRGENEGCVWTLGAR